MTRISLPLDRSTRLLGPAFILCTCVLVLSCQTAWPWRLAVVGAVLVLGFRLWSSHLGRRPVCLIMEGHGALSCILADGRTFQVERVIPGIIRPWLLCGRLVGGAGDWCDLLVPGGHPSADAHWQLRRALIGFRAPQPPDRRGV